MAGQARLARARPLREDGQAVGPGALAWGCLASTPHTLLSAGPQGTPGQPILGLLPTMEGLGQVEAWVREGPTAKGPSFLGDWREPERRGPEEGREVGLL